ncbi:aquaporin NIP2-1-like [Abrus precatorius]|uniref:Aquaporin NIP2-1-like n=1 Tax=Abrus precatorius TaxID=3816 RepID=A0A8B8L5L7_ABRPR|nr:aquaporin NIP2-1-like [Abrus precatorius]
MEGTNQNICSYVADTIELQIPSTPESSSPSLSFTRLAESYPPGFTRKVFAEVIGTFLLVFVGSGTAGLSAIDENKVSKLAASLAGGFIVTVMIYSIGHISGAHMNPAVSLAFASVKHLPWPQVPFYVAAQLTGAISASYTLRELFQPSKQIGATTSAGSHLQALIMEMVTTFTMVFISMAVATDPKATGQLSGVAVGSSVSIASIIAGPISGGSMNPARTLGPAIASSNYKGLWVYFVGPVTGALLAAWSYGVIKETDQPSAFSLSSFSFKQRQSNIRTDQVGKSTHRCLV